MEEWANNVQVQLFEDTSSTLHQGALACAHWIGEMVKHWHEMAANVRQGMPGMVASMQDLWKCALAVSVENIKSKCLQSEWRGDNLTGESSWDEVAKHAKKVLFTDKYGMRATQSSRDMLEQDVELPYNCFCLSHV